MKIELYAPLSIHEIGNRPKQEDSLYPQEDRAKADNRLFIVCDGMGGHEKGEVASQTVCQALGGWFSSNVNPAEPFTDDMLQEAIDYAYKALDKYDNGDEKKMGTTLTLLYMHSRGISVAHIGDSRIYHIRPKEDILYQSCDHSLVFELFRSGEIEYDEMATHPQKNVITRAMTPGEENRAKPYIVHITDVKPNDWFYMCSDGMLEQMNNDELLARFSEDTTDEKKRDNLIEATRDNQDNHTAWLLHVKNVIHEPGDENLVNEEPSSSYNAINIIRASRQEEIKSEEDLHSDVEIVGGEDVTVVPQKKPVAHTPSYPKFSNIIGKKSKRLLLILIFAIVVCLFFFVSYVLFNGKKDPRERESKEPTTKITVTIEKTGEERQASQTQGKNDVSDTDIAPSKERWFNSVSENIDEIIGRGTENEQ